MKNHDRIKVLGAMFLFGAPLNIVCYFNHVCMAGHLHHQPYPAWTYIVDFLWGILFLSCGVFSIRTKAKRSNLFSLFCFLFVFMRLLAVGDEILLPLYVYAVWLSVRYIICTSKYDLSVKSDPGKAVVVAE
jgi:hypothetical protein